MFYDSMVICFEYFMTNILSSFIIDITSSWNIVW